jgi:hypothetical protein
MASTTAGILGRIIVRGGGSPNVSWSPIIHQPIRPPPQFIPTSVPTPPLVPVREVTRQFRRYPTRRLRRPAAPAAYRRRCVGRRLKAKETGDAIVVRRHPPPQTIDLDNVARGPPSRSTIVTSSPIIVVVMSPPPPPPPRSHQWHPPRRFVVRQTSWTARQLPFQQFHHHGVLHGIDHVSVIVEGRRRCLRRRWLQWRPQRSRDHSP